jgi:poly(3-hydroxybutyrate) depolymerase
MRTRMPLPPAPAPGKQRRERGSRAEALRTAQRSAPSARPGSHLPQKNLGEVELRTRAEEPVPFSLPHAVYGGGSGRGAPEECAAFGEAPDPAVLPLSPRGLRGEGRGGGLALALLALTATACTPSLSDARHPVPAPGYRLVPPLAAEAQARADSVITEIDRLPAEPWQAATFRGSDGVEIAYRLLPPPDPQPGRRYPLVVVFHGSGEIGTDNARHLNRLPRMWARPEIRRAYPAWVLAPQMPERSANYTAGPEAAERAVVPGRPLFAALELVDRLRATLPVDSSRVYAFGFSMGASTVYAALGLRPELFAAAVPVAGVPDRAQAERVAQTPLWIIHGNSDEENPIGPDRAFYPVLAAVPGARATFWEYDAGEHRVPVDLLSTDAVARWLWAHHKS